MQIKIFTIPVFADDCDVEELNLFLRSHKIIDVKRELTQANDNNCWTFCITYMPNTALSPATMTKEGGQHREKVDYKELLDAETFERFARMRKLRKEIAESEAVPAYAVFTDAELAEIAKLTVLDTANMLRIPGIGKKKVEKYGNAFCMIDVTQLDGDETSRIPDGADSQS